LDRGIRSVTNLEHFGQRLLFAPLLLASGKGDSAPQSEVHMKFWTPKTVITANALRELHYEDVLHYLGEHFSGKWGNLGPEDCQANEHALKHGLRILSKYRDRRGNDFYIISDPADIGWSLTTVLLVSDY